MQCVAGVCVIVGNEWYKCLCELVLQALQIPEVQQLEEQWITAVAATTGCMDVGHIVYIGTSQCRLFRIKDQRCWQPDLNTCGYL